MGGKEALGQETQVAYPCGGRVFNLLQRREGGVEKEGGKKGFAISQTHPLNGQNLASYKKRGETIGRIIEGKVRCSDAVRKCTGKVIMAKQAGGGRWESGDRS